MSKSKSTKRNRASDSKRAKSTRSRKAKKEELVSPEADLSECDPLAEVGAEVTDEAEEEEAAQFLEGC